MITGIMGQTQESFDNYLHGLKNRFENVPQISADSTRFDSILLLDTREKEEYEISRIQNAIWVGPKFSYVGLFDSIERSTKIVVYCSVGYRSSVFARELLNAGFKHTYNLYGGIFKWANDGRPLYKDEKIIDRIHGYNRKWARFIRNPLLQIVY